MPLVQLACPRISVEHTAFAATLRYLDVGDPAFCCERNVFIVNAFSNLRSLLVANFFSFGDPTLLPYLTTLRTGATDEPELWNAFAETHVDLRSLTLVSLPTAGGFEECTMPCHLTTLHLNVYGGVGVAEPFVESLISANEILQKISVLCAVSNAIVEGRCHVCMQKVTDLTLVILHTLTSIL